MLQGYLGNWSLESPVGADSHLQSDARVANCSLCGCSLNQNKEIAQVMNLVCWYDNLRTPLKMFYTSSIKDIKALLHLLLSQNRTRKSDCKGILSNQTCVVTAYALMKFILFIFPFTNFATVFHTKWQIVKNKKRFRGVFFFLQNFTVLFGICSHLISC